MNPQGAAVPASQRDGIIVTPIERADIRRTIATHYQGQTFTRALQNAARHRTEEHALLHVLARFIQYCSVFGGCQASLAGEVAVQQELFQGPVAAALCADSSVEVAAGVFFGAIDEFGDRESRAAANQQHTHRSLAQATLIGLCRFFGCDPAVVRRASAEHLPTRRAVQGALAGYGVNQHKGEDKIFRALGFHLATELLADEEFCTIDAVLRAERPDLVAYLSEQRIEHLGQKLPAYFWISRHTVADAEHFDAAIECANQALRYYAGRAGRAQVRDFMLRGVEEMALVEAGFMSGVDQS